MFVDLGLQCTEGSDGLGVLLLNSKAQGLSCSRLK
jgi:hypothetical protein